MFDSISQVNKEVFKLFQGVKITKHGKEKDVLCRYAKKSSLDYVEEQDNQEYPCIVIADYTPTLNDSWYLDMKTYSGGVSFDGIKGYIYRRPIWMEFRFDVSIASKSYLDHIALKDYFMKHFLFDKSFLLNQWGEGEQAVGDVVAYEVRETDLPRTDGIFETNYEFTINPWVHIRDPKEAELVQSMVLTLTEREL